MVIGMVLEPMVCSVLQLYDALSELCSGTLLKYLHGMY